MAAGAAKCQGARPMSQDKDDRQQRLAAALRENLKRRKAQAREAAATKTKDRDEG